MHAASTLLCVISLLRVDDILFSATQGFCSCRKLQITQHGFSRNKSKTVNPARVSPIQLTANSWLNANSRCCLMGGYKVVKWLHLSRNAECHRSITRRLNTFTQNVKLPSLQTSRDLCDEIFLCARKYHELLHFPQTSFLWHDFNEVWLCNFISFLCIWNFCFLVHCLQNWGQTLNLQWLLRSIQCKHGRYFRFNLLKIHSDENF